MYRIRFLDIYFGSPHYLLRRYAYYLYIHPKFIESDNPRENKVSFANTLFNIYLEATYTKCVWDEHSLGRIWSNNFMMFILHNFMCLPKQQSISFQKYLIS